MHVTIRKRLNICIVLGLAIIALYFFRSTGGDFTFQVRNEAEYDQYSYDFAILADAFLKGQLHLTVTPPQELTTHVIPYDFARRPKVPYIWDASLYNGRYYLYFTPVPVLLIYLPYYAVTRHFPDNRGVSFGLTLGIFIVLCAIFFEGTRAQTRILVRDVSSILMLGLGAGLLITVTESHWYGISILSGSFFSSLFVLSLFKTLRDKDSNFWIIIASVALGLALWSRPVLLPLIPLGAWFIFSVLRKQRRLDRRVICAAFLPCAFILAMAGMYNYARFDSPFEFGLTYQLSLRNNYSFPVSLSDPFQLIQRVAAALPSILLNPLTFFADSWDFSRRHVSTMPIPPTGDYLLGDPNDLIAGLFWIAPYLLGLPWVLGAKLKVWEYDQYRLANAMIFTGIGVMVLVANFGFVANRYHLDYLPLIGVGATVLFCQKISFEKGGARRWVYDLVWLVTGIFVSWINFNLI